LWAVDFNSFFEPPPPYFEELFRLAAESRTEPDVGLVEVFEPDDAELHTSSRSGGHPAQIKREIRLPETDITWACRCTQVQSATFESRC